MRDTVFIKSFPNGITLHLDPEMPFEDLLKEVAYKFSEARAFFGKMSVALSIEDRVLTEPEEIRVLEAIQTNSNLKIICIVYKDNEMNRYFVKALAHVEKKAAESDDGQDGQDGQFFRGSLKNREILETESSIIILGDICPGCTVVSGKNIIVLGGLYGEACAGGNGEEGAFIAALEMEPERIKIGDFKYRPNKQSKWGIRQKLQPKIAYVKNNKITFETLTKDMLSTF